MKFELHGVIVLVLDPFGSPEWAWYQAIAPNFYDEIEGLLEKNTSTSKKTHPPYHHFPFAALHGSSTSASLEGVELFFATYVAKFT
jgi:predicted choloylglycine hydrolase